jgi:CelD/BcsL family acetyltransferase involved in cellulose biosynthesis
MSGIRFTDSRSTKDTKVLPQDAATRTPDPGGEGGTHPELTAGPAPDATQIELYCGRQGLANLREEWVRLSTALPRKRFCHLFVWYDAYLSALENRPDDVYFFVCKHAGTIAVFPFRRSMRRRRGLKLRVLELPHHPHMNLTDFILDPSAGDGTLLRRVIDHIRALPDFDWDEIYLPTVTHDSAIARLFERDLLPRTVRVARRQAAFVRCDEPYEAVANRFRGRFRRNLRRLTRRAAETGTLDYRSYRTPVELELAFPHLLEVEAAGWKGRQGTAIECDPKTVQFYQHLMRGADPEARCIINLMTLNGICVAGQFCMLVDGVLYVLKIGYRERYARLAPGHLLMTHVIRRCCDDPDVRAISFVLNPSWTRLFRPELLPVYDFHISNHTWRGWITYLWRGVRRLAPDPREADTTESASDDPS